MSLDPEPVYECRVDGCSFDTRGTEGGAGAPICVQGGLAPCLMSFMSTDPGDIDWSEYATYGNSGGDA